MTQLFALWIWFMRLNAIARYALMSLAVVAVAVLAGFLWIVTGPGPMDFAGGQSMALAQYRGADPTGVPAALRRASLIERGQYLARASDCTACHTAPGGKPFAGGLAINTPFGTLYSSNITPDKQTGIGTYSDADFLKAVHRGIAPGGKHLYPAMPYDTYAYMTDSDALAIKAYLFSLGPVHQMTPKSALTFPFNQRWLMAIWQFLLVPDTRFEPNTAQSAEWNRGAYLSEAMAHCGDCHTPRNLMQAPDNRSKFSGAAAAGWRAYNITADGTGVGSWTNQALADYLATGHAAGHGTASGTMGEAVDHSFSYLTKGDIRALVVYLRSIPAITSSDLPATLAGPAPESHQQGVPMALDPRGKRVFEGACASCHAWSGVSPLTPLATLTGARAVNDPVATNVAQIVISGTTRKTAHGMVTMPAFGAAYSDAEIAAVANYVTARFGSTGSKITTGEVAALRQQVSR